MTITEAADRARLIWGQHRFFSVRMRPDGGADVTLLQAHTLTNPDRPLASDTRGRHYTAHQLNASGQPVCHVDCESLVDGAPLSVPR